MIQFTAYSQTKFVKVPVSELRKATELIIQGKQYKSLDSLKTLEIQENKIQISSLQRIRFEQSEIIKNQNSIIANSSRNITELQEIVEYQANQIKKARMKAVISQIGAVVVFVLVLI